MNRPPDYYEAIVTMYPDAQVSAVWTDDEGHTELARTIPEDGSRTLKQMLYFRIRVNGDVPFGEAYLRALTNEVEGVTADLGRYLKSVEGREFSQGILPGLTELFAEARILAGREETR